MKIIRFEVHGDVQWGLVRPDGTIERAIEKAPWNWVATGERVTPHRLLAPIEPRDIFAVGKNYAEHAKEFDPHAEPMPYPIIFMKPTSSVIGPGEPIRIPLVCNHGPEVDYEVELVAVIGPKPVRNVSEADALDVVFGYTIANDVSARKWQKNAGGGQWIRGKSFDTFCPLGPAIVTRDEFADPQNLKLRTLLNGQVMQDSTTADMTFNLRQLIAFISRDTTLLPGTLILTGTPSGVGAARTPPVFLQPGDTVTLEIEGIGQLTNPVLAS